MNLRTIIFGIAFYCISISSIFAAPEILETSMKENGIHPKADMKYDVTYQDTNGGINPTTANLEIYKYTGTGWSTDLGSGVITTGNTNIGPNHAIYSLPALAYGKYKFIFSIENIHNESVSNETIFFIDEPEIHISRDAIDIGALTLDLQKESNEFEQITVKTIGTPYRIQLIDAEGLDNGTWSIDNYDGIEGWGINKSPFDSGEIIQPITNPDDIGNNTYRLNNNGEKFEDVYIFRFGAKYTDPLQAAGEYEGTFDIDIKMTYCSEYESDNLTCKLEPIKIEETAGVKQWADGTYSKTCLDYQMTDNTSYSYLGDIGDGYYMIQPDPTKPAFKTYCNMTINGGGWTQYVNIKGNYTFEDAKSCWLGTNISNNSLDCFNPNRYNIEVKALYNDDWSGDDFFYNISNVGVDVSHQSATGGYRCLGHSEYMTVMGSGSYPDANANGTSWIRLGRNYCGFSREVAGRSTNAYMNYNNGVTGFGTSSGADRENSAKLHQLYFREQKVGSGSGIVSYNSGRRWEDGTYAKDCKEYKFPPTGYDYSGDIGDGNYYIDNDGAGANPPYLAYCDMSTDGGGWTKLQEWNDSGINDFISGDFSGGDEILMTYKRKHTGNDEYAIKIKQFKTKQCGDEYTTIADYVDHLLTGSWGYCGRIATIGDYNDIITEKVIDGSYINDVCVNGSGHKTSSRNASWGTSGGRGYMQYRVSDTTVLMGPKGNGSARCAGTRTSSKAQNAVTTWVR